ncbi:MAG: hypothetical protein OES32_16075 [Acidobacteriota bacterium]|nr:hypothetical protein [Acidobacteriota bacterium]
MRTTVEIADSLFERAKTTMVRRGTTFRALVEEGLARVVEEAEAEPQAAAPRRAIFDGELGLAAPYQPYDLPELLRRERMAGREQAAGREGTRGSG